MLLQDVHDGLQMPRVGVIKSGQCVGIDVEYAPHAVVVAQWYDDFGLRMRRAGYVVGVFVDIGDDNRAVLLPRLAAYAASVCDAGAGGRALKWAQYQLAAADKVKAHPMPAKMLMQRGDGIGHAGNGVGFAFEQGGDLGNEVGVLLVFVGHDAGVSNGKGQ